MSVSEKLKALGVELPSPVTPIANYTPFIVSEKTLYISGQIPVRDGVLAYKGTVGDEVSTAGAVEAARLCAVNILGQVNQAVGEDWSKIKRCLKLGGFVSCGPGFTDHSKVINGASDLIVSVLGAAGKHTRFAVGASSLPLGAAVEVEALFQLT